MYSGFTVAFVSPEDVEPHYECSRCGARNPGAKWRRHNNDWRCPADCDPYEVEGYGHPIPCNYQITSHIGGDGDGEECEQTGCNLSDCCHSVAVGWGCPLCGSKDADLEEVRDELTHSR